MTFNKGLAIFVSEVTLAQEVEDEVRNGVAGYVFDVLHCLIGHPSCQQLITCRCSFNNYVSVNPLAFNWFNFTY